MAEQINNINVDVGIGAIGTNNGTINIGIKEKFIPTLEWAKEKIEIALKGVGNRYITYNDLKYQDLNIELPLQDLFNSVTNSEDFNFSNFYSILNCDNYNEAKDYAYSNGVMHYFEKYKNLEFYKVDDKSLIFKNHKKDENEYIAYVYYNFSKEIEILLNFYTYYTELLNIFSNEQSLKKQFFNKNTIDLINNIENSYSQIKSKSSMQLIDKYMGPFDGPYIVEKIYKLKKRAQWLYDQNLYSLIRYIGKKKIEKTDKLNYNNQLATFLFKHTLIVGEAMSGKTHMLSDIAKNRIEDNKPTILIYAQNFVGYDRPIQHIIKQLHLERYGYSDEDFLKMLDDWGRSTNEIVFLIIDAINETPERNVWRNHFVEFVSLVKKYRNLALIMSIRDVEKDWLFNDSMNLYVSNTMIEIEHKGFEEIKFPVLKRFCEVFRVNIPTFPLLSPIFANPGLLFLFFETLKRNGIQEIDEQILKPNFIIHEYIKNMNNRFRERHNIQNHRTYIHNTTNIVAEEIVEHNFIESIAYETVYPKTVLIHEQILEYLISEGVFLKRTTTLDELFIYFSYQRFGNYFIALYLLPEGLSLENIQKNETIKKLLSSFHDNKMIIEALIIRLNETHKIDIKEIFTDLFTDSELNKFRYECLNKSLDIPEVNKNEFIDVFSSDFEEQTMRLDNLLRDSVNFKSNLNISQNLHESLLAMQITQRDYHWSIYIHNSYGNDGIVKKIINWAWDKEVSFEINDDSLYLYGLTLGWFLTSSNRVLRDGATKSLVNIFTDRVDIFYKVLRAFESVNDLYVLERLYAVGYGITLRSRNYSNFKEFGLYIYQTIFNVESVVEHILLRDYAMLTVEHINRICLLDIDLQKVQPPYRSVMPSSYPTNEEIKNHQDSLGRGISSIISSMRTESMGHYGDFGRYTFQANLSHFNLQPIKFQDLSNYAVHVILEEYISDMKLFENAESRLQTHSSSRYDHNVERIGKKYQWMALHKVLAIVADNFEIEDYQEKREFVSYQGTYQTYIRDIDPTTILKNKHEKIDKWVIDLNSDFEHSELSDIDWMGSVEKLPTVSGLINLLQNEKEYLMLSTSFSIDGNKEEEKYRNLYYHIDSFIIEKKNLDTFLYWAKKQNFYGQNKMPKTSNFHEVFLREYPNSKAYAHIDSYYYGQMNWEDTFEHEEGKIPCKVLLTSTTYFNEGRSYDMSVDEGIEIYLPNKWLINKLNLKQTLRDGEWVNDKGEVVFFDQTIRSNIEFEYKSNNALMANKELLLKFLDENGLSIVWVMWGEKQVRETEINLNHDDFLGISEIDGFAYFDGNKIVDSNIRIQFTESKK